MAFLLSQLELEQCPHCSVDKPTLNQFFTRETRTHNGNNLRYWGIYACSRCGGAILAAAQQKDGYVIEMYPSAQSVSEAIPNPAREYLTQAIDSLHAPAGSVMLSASAVDAMLKAKNYLKGNLYDRINQASENHLITIEMATWAHDVRLDANDQRHADVNAPLPTDTDAKKCIEFTLALAEFLFALPKRVARGRGLQSDSTESSGKITA